MHRVYVKWSLVNHKPAYFIIWFSFNINFRFSIKWYSRAQKVIWHKYVKYTCSMETCTTKWPFYTFLVNSPLIYILFSMGWPASILLDVSRGATNQSIQVSLRSKEILKFSACLFLFVDILTFPLQKIKQTAF